MLATCATLAALAWVFWGTPADVNLGIVQKIFYLHVAAAFGMLLCLCAASAAALIDLLAPSDPVDAAGRACTEVGLAFAAVVLTTGPLWARKSWGTWWTWEPRLTLTLLVLLIAIAVLLLRGLAASAEAGRRTGNALAVLAAPTSYLIHIAVQKWGGTHPMVIQGGGIQSSAMRIAFWGMVAALLGLGTALVALRTRGIRLDQRLRAVQLELSARDLRQRSDR
jgi:heme exporter protein C